MPAPLAPSPRMLGVDAARGLAIIGMLVAHTADDGSAESLADGRSAVLFATLAGVSLGLLTGGSRPVVGTARWTAAGSVALRALVLVVLGLVLGTLGSGVAVILDSYGALFVALLPVLFAPRWALAALTAAAALVGPALVAAAGQDLSTPGTPQRYAHLLGEWFVTGYYPGAVFAAFLLAGLLAARSDLTARRTQLTLVIGGGAASLLGYGTALAGGFDASAHSGTTWEVLGSGGLALAVLGALQLLLARHRLPALVPLVAAGSMPLTVYTGQVVVLAAWLTTPGAGDPPSIASWRLLAGLVLGSLLFALAWRRFVGRGPLEAALGALTRIPARPRAAPSGGPTGTDPRPTLRP